MFDRFPFHEVGRVLLDLVPMCGEARAEPATTSAMVKLQQSADCLLTESAISRPASVGHGTQDGDVAGCRPEGPIDRALPFLPPGAQDGVADRRRLRRPHRSSWRRLRCTGTSERNAGRAAEAPMEVHGFLSASVPGGTARLSRTKQLAPRYCRRSQLDRWAAAGPPIGRPRFPQVTGMAAERRSRRSGCNRRAVPQPGLPPCGARDRG